MQELQKVEAALAQAVRRQRVIHLWQGFWRGLLVGGCIWIVAFGAFKALPLPPWIIPSGAIAAGATLAGFLLFFGFKQIRAEQVARQIDQRKQLKDRFSTAVELAHSPEPVDSPWKRLVITDAAAHLDKLDIRQLMPFGLPKASRWALMVVALGAGLGFVPEYRSQEYRQRQQDIAHVRETAGYLTNFTRRTIEQRQPQLETKEALEAAHAAGERLAQGKLGRTEALRDLANAAQKLEQQSQALSRNPALKPLERAAREPNSGSTTNPDTLRDQMQQAEQALGKAPSNTSQLDKLRQEMQKAREALAGLSQKSPEAARAASQELAQQLSSMAQKANDAGQWLDGLDNAIQALKKFQPDTALRDLDFAMQDLEKTRQMAQALQQMRQQAESLGKDLGEQLQRGQAQSASQTLKKMVEQLKQGNLSREAMQKMMQEVSRAIDPASPYGKVGDCLKQAANQMQSGQKSGASQSLAQAASELDKLMKQMADAEALNAAMAAMDRAQQAIATGQSWEQAKAGNCKACQGLGCSSCSKPGNWGYKGGAGGGVGAWADDNNKPTPKDSERWDNSQVKRPDMASKGHTDRPDDRREDLMPTRVRGQMTPGAPMPSISLKGVSIKGQSTVEFKEAATAAQAEAQSALSQDQVPRAYQESVRDYFDDLKE